MNAASRDLSFHLAALHERMMHPTDYERAVHYFLEEFAGDVEFVRGSDRDQAPHLLGIVRQTLAIALDKPVQLNAPAISYLREHRFFHGSAKLGRRAVLFFYFERSSTGVIMLTPGVGGQMDVARFHLPRGLADPRAN